MSSCCRLHEGKARRKDGRGSDLVVVAYLASLRCLWGVECVALRARGDGMVSEVSLLLLKRTSCVGGQWRRWGGFRNDVFAFEANRVSSVWQARVPGPPSTVSRTCKKKNPVIF